MPAVGVFIVTKNDTLIPINALLTWANGDPVNLASYTVSFLTETEDGTSDLAATTTGVTAHPTQAFTASATTDLLTCAGHGVKEGDQIVVANSGGALPAGLSASTRYFAINVTSNAFGLSSLPSGPTLDITDAGSGTNTFYIVGSVQMDLPSAAVDTAGTYRGWFKLTSGGETKYMPEGDRWIELRVVEAGN